MTSLLFFQALLVLVALKRGWRIAPFVLLALPRLFAEAASGIPELALAGWVLPFANLLVAVGALSTLCLLYTAVADPEPA